MENLSGHNIKGYELRERIGAGGFGAVYRAHQSTVAREVAIKIILPGFANQPDFIRRFETEAQLIARLEHLHIIPLYDYWRDPNGAYLVMRYLRGGSLYDALKNAPLDVGAAALLLDQVTSALDTAHRKGVIHRDIKPGNILLDEDGNAYLADFGIAKDLKIQGNGMTEPDAIMGSLDYIAPEQARGEPVTPRTDIYSLGVVLYEMLTGKHPFPDLNSVERLFKHLNEPLPEILTLDPSVQDGINAVIQKATAKNPANRYASALDFAAAFHQAADVTHSSVDLVEQLTQREQEILQFIIDGHSNKEIAQKLFVTIATVKWYITMIYRKLGVRTRIQAIVRARELQLITTDRPAVDEVPRIPTEQFNPPNPYKGLRAFESADVQDFFGRERLVDKLVKRLSISQSLPNGQAKGEGEGMGRFLAVVGPSGSGKSSLVKAGLIPALWRGDLPGSEKWFVVEMLPGARPLDELEIALTRIAANQAANLHDHLERDQHGLTRAARLILPNDGSELVIVIDQFEEVFTLVENEAERTHFLNLIHDAVTDPRSRVRVIVTLRADFYDRPLRYPDFGELVRNQMETVLPLGASELERAIAEPARRMGVTFEEGLIAQIVSEINYQPGALPLLQYALTELFERRAGRILTHAAYQEIGRAGGALARRSEEIYLELPPAAQELARQMFLRLVTLGEGVENTRRRTARSELLAVGGDDMDEIIDTFAAYRLLALDNDPGTRTPTVEVAHEALLREWERLRGWLNDSRDEIKLQRQLAAMAAEWREAKQDVSFLARGARLERFEGWAKDTQLALTHAERQFLDTSIGQRDQEHRAEIERKARETKLEKRSQMALRILVGVFALAAFVATGLSLFAFTERTRAERNADELRSVALIAGADDALDEGQPHVALALARESVNMDNPPLQAQRAFFQIAHSNWIRHRFTGFTARVYDALYHPDGKRILTSSYDGRVIVWDAATGEILQSLEREGSHNYLAIHPDGKRIAIGSSNATALLWNLETDELRELKTYGAFQNSVVFNRDGSLLITANDDGTINVWDVETLELTHSFKAHDSGILTARFSPEGSLLLTASADASLHIWDFASGELLKTFKHPDGQSYIWEGLFLADGEHILLGGDGNLLTLWNWRSGEVVWSRQHPSVSVQDIALSSDERYFVTGSSDDTHEVYLWDTQTGQLLRTYQGHTLRVQNVAFSPDNRWIVSASNDRSVIVWPVLWEGAQLEHFIPGIGGGVLHPTERRVAASERYPASDVPQGIVNLLNLDTGKAIRTLSGHKGYGVAQGFSPDGHLLVTSDFASLLPDDEQDVYIWEVESGKLLHVLDEHIGWVSRITFSPDGKIFAASERQGARIILWDVQTGASLRILEGHKDWVNSVIFSPDGQKLYSAGRDGSLYVWDAASGQKINEWAGHSNEIIGIDLNTDGTMLATASRDGTAVLWDTTSGERLKTLDWHSGQVSSVSFSPDSRYLLTGSLDAGLILWDVATGKALRRYVGHSSSSLGVWVTGEFLPDGQSFVSFSANRFMLWDASPLPEDLTTWVSKNRYIPELTCEQRTLYRIEPLCSANPS